MIINLVFDLNNVRYKVIKAILMTNMTKITQVDNNRLLCSLLFIKHQSPWWRTDLGNMRFRLFCYTVLSKRNSSRKSKNPQSALVQTYVKVNNFKR